MLCLASKEIEKDQYTRVTESDEGEEVQWICTQGLDAELKEIACFTCEACPYSAKEI